MLNRYPLWKNILIFGIVLIGAILALPNIYGEDPSVQISPTRDTVVDNALQERVESVLKANAFAPKRVELNENQLLIRFNNTDEQIKAKDVLASELQKDYVTALNLAPDMPQWLENLGLRPMYLGLDLRGGVHFLLEIDMEGLINQLSESYADNLETTLKDEKLSFKSVQHNDDNSITIHFDSNNEVNRALQFLSRQGAFEQLNFTTESNRLRGVISSEELSTIRRNTVTQNIRTLRNRVNELGVAEPVIQQQGQNRIVVQLPGVQDTARAKEILGTTATLEFRMVDERSATEAYKAAERGRAPLGTELYYTREGAPYLLKRQIILTGDSIVKASAGIDPESPGGAAIVYITIDSKGTDKFSEATKLNVGKPMATLFIENIMETEIDEEGNEVKKSVTTKEIANVATIQSQLFSNFTITGLSSLAEANNLAITLNSGALAAPIHIIEERTIGPSAGQDNIDSGMKAATYGFLLVILFMVIRYRSFGVVANIALAANLMLILAILSLLQATLTLPGIAGIVLTLGMSVDANVLINERIREEIRKGTSPHNSINSGFSSAFTTIMDANLTTLFAALALFYIGSGPIKGFAVTLSIGILTSIFTAVYVNRAIINLIWGKKQLKKLSVGRKELFKALSGEANYQFMRFGKQWIYFSFFVIIIGIIVTASQGFKFGLDFTGGTEVNVTYEKSVDNDIIRQQLTTAGFDNAVVQHFGASNEVLISIPTPEEVTVDIESDEEAIEVARISDTIIQVLANDENPFVIRNISFVGSQVGDELVMGGIVASTVAILLILIYIWFRFERKLALGSILATIHDTVIIVTIFSLFKGKLEFDLTSLAAILAVIGYSVNDSVVVLDRIRENFRLLRTGSTEEIVNLSINQTLSRTIMTSITTALAVLSLYLFGGSAIETFALIMLIGVFVGTYSSIFISAAGALRLGLKREDLLPPVVDKKAVHFDEGYPSV